MTTRGFPTLHFFGRIATLGAAALWIGAISPHVAAGDGRTALSPSRVLHEIRVEAVPEAELPAFTQLVHVLNEPDASTSTMIVPGTSDVQPESSPWIAAEPAEGSRRAVLIWSHWDGDEEMEEGDYEILVSLFDGTAWSAPVFATDDAFDHISARAAWGASGLIHLMWKRDDGGTIDVLHMQMDATGQVVSGPSVVNRPADEIVTNAGGQTTPGLVEPDLDILFAFSLPIGPGGGMSVYGGRDEPMPIGFRADFLLPAGSQSISGAPEADRTGSRLTLSFVLSGHYVYTWRDDDGWMPYNRIRLTGDMSEDKAGSLLDDMLLESSATP